MTDEPAQDELRPRILIPDTTPLSLLGMVRGLDWLFAPGAELWITDMVWHEVLRDPGEGKDRRVKHRAEIAEWLDRNRHRIKRIPTEVGQRYEADMDGYGRALELWRRAGSPPDLRPALPDWKDRGDESILPAVKAANKVLAAGECVVTLADDRNLRAAIIVLMAGEPAAAVNLLCTQTFLEWVRDDYGVEEAGSAWPVIELASGRNAPDRADPDPVYLRGH
ncbi:hypothetical protein [Azospirillum sp. SYSU D00513]|uniref:hypothetical protein n=1 Tax=Azospirillum sp. SYSU D00513 TaxID=2812561 RepID=UPI001A957FD5|nr:hypothetical protein [Azospirillum sp. SYSU D00513]